MADLELEERSEGRPAQAGSLKPVIDIIPAAAYENPTWKGMAYFLRDVAMYVAVVSALILFSNVFVVAGLEVVMALITTALFVVGHDAAHGALFKSKRTNSIVGHLAMLPSMHVYEGWVLGHNRVHHPYTVRQGYDFVWHPYTVEDYRAMGFVKRMRHRFEWSWFGAGAYYLREVWLNKMITGPFPARWVKAINRDRAVVLGWAGAFAVGLALIALAQGDSLFGIAWMITRVEILPFLAFCVMIGSVVHVHHVQPTIRWWKRAEWTERRCCEFPRDSTSSSTGSWCTPRTTSTFASRCTTCPWRQRRLKSTSPTSSTTRSCASVTSGATPRSASSTTSTVERGCPTPQLVRARNSPPELSGLWSAPSR